MYQRRRKGEGKETKTLMETLEMLEKYVICKHRVKPHSMFLFIFCFVLLGL